MMSDIGRPCSGREPHSTRFKDHLLHHLPEWTDFAQGRGVFISHKVMVGTVLAQTYHSSYIDQDEALLLIRAAMALRKRILKKQEPLRGSFSYDCLSSPVEETVLSGYKGKDRMNSFPTVDIQHSEVCNILRQHRNPPQQES